MFIITCLVFFLCNIWSFLTDYLREKNKIIPNVFTTLLGTIICVWSLFPEIHDRDFFPVFFCFYFCMPILSGILIKYNSDATNLIIKLNNVSVFLLSMGFIAKILFSILLDSIPGTLDLLA